MEPTPDDPTALARAALGPRRYEVVPIGTGFGNRNWRVTDDDGRRFVLKVGPPASATKWRAANEGRELAAAVGVPSPRLHRVVELETALVRVFEWIDGEPLTVLAHDPATSAHFGEELGATVARLHELHPDEYTSRLDGSAPGFTEWQDYVGHRVAEIRERCARAGTPDQRTVERACAEIIGLAGAVSADARPTLCHRDLHPDNLLTDLAGGLVGILDWDMTEAWDQAGDTFKLRTMLFADLPDAEAAFETAYRSVHPELPGWAERVRLVDLLETLNAVANASLRSWGDHGAEMTRRLDDLLG